MLYIWHSGYFMKPTHKWYFWPFLYQKIAFFVIFAQICPKNMYFWMVDITFFVFVVSRDWRYMLEFYYYTFKKIKKFWSWPTSVGPVHPSKSKTMKKKFLKLGNFTTHYSPSKRIYKIYILRIFWSWQNFKMKLPNFKVCFIFSNFCVYSLKYISKLAREWKLAEICLFEFDYQEFPIFVHENVLNYYTCVIYIFFWKIFWKKKYFFQHFCQHRVQTNLRNLLVLFKTKEL